MSSLTFEKIKGGEKIKKQAIIMILSIIFVLTICGTVSAADRNVGPGYTYANITDAVNAASSGDNIYVYDNNGSAYIYAENVIVNKTNLNITAKGKVTVTAKDPDSAVFSIYPTANGSAIRNFKITGATTGYGIFLGSSYNTIQNNAIYGNWVGIRIPPENTHNTIINNTIYGNDEGIWADDNSNNTISGNNISNNSGTAIGAQGSDYLTITNNTINNNMRGIDLDGSDFNTISNNILKNNTINGIHVLDSNNCEITGNIVTNSQVGILLETLNPDYPCVENTVAVNTIQNNNVGIHIHGSSQNGVSRNTINNNNIGIEVDDLVISGVGAPSDGTIAQSSNNIILANDIYNNGDGISFASIFSTPSGNQVYCNRIVNNTSWGLVNYSSENVDATYNWWGSNSSPSGKIYGSHVKYDPWLVLKVYALPASTYPGGFSTITADLNHGSDGSFAQNNLPDGINVLFSADKGNIASPKTIEFGLAKSVLYVPTSSAGTVNVSVVVDAQTVNVQVPVKILQPYSIQIKNLKKWTVHYLYYVKIVKPDGQITTKTFRGDLRGYRSVYINLGNLPQGSKIQITSYITNKNRFKRTVSVSNTIIKPRWSWSYQWIYQKNVRASPGKLWRNPVIRSTTIRI